MSKFNLQGLLVTGYGVLISLALGNYAGNYVPDFSTAICNIASPQAQFENELQFAKSAKLNDECINKAKISQLLIISLIIFGGYTQFIHCLLLSSLLVSKNKTNVDDKKFHYTENTKILQSGLLSEYFEQCNNTRFHDFEAMKASYMAQKLAVDGFCNSIESRNHTQDSVNSDLIKIKSLKK